jgi:hypothetical protein
VCARDGPCVRREGIDSLQAGWAIHLRDEEENTVQAQWQVSIKE